jgi:hypothetical protein
MIEHDAAAPVRREHDRLLPTQQSRQNRASIGRQPEGEIGGHHRQWAREDIRHNQIVPKFTDPAVAVAGRCAAAYEAGDPVACGVVAGHANRSRINIAA